MNAQDKRLVQAYLFFNGRCEEALEFYRASIGAEIQFTMRYKDSPEAQQPGTVPPGFENKIMHTSFRVGQTTIMASDGCSTDQPGFQGFSLALTVPAEAEAKRAFEALAVEGQIRMPLSPTFWSPCFGMVEDRFGISWMIMVPGPEQP